MGHPDEEPAGDGGVDHAGRPPRLAGRDPRERRRRRRRLPAQGGVRGAVALARQPVVEPGADGCRPSRPPAGDALSCHHGSDRAGPDLPGCGRLRPGAGRESDARRSHPRAHLPTHPPLTRTDSKGIWPGSTSWGQASSPLVTLALREERHGGRSEPKRRRRRSPCAVFYSTSEPTKRAAPAAKNAAAHTRVRATASTMPTPSIPSVKRSRESSLNTSAETA